jgi:hypothetical protein
MNIYDPAERICYVHLSPEVDSWSLRPGDSLRCIELPVGYANRSPRTRLGHRPTESLEASARTPSHAA